MNNMEMKTGQLSVEPLWARLMIAGGAFTGALAISLSAYATHGPSLMGSSPIMVQTALHFLQIHAMGLILVGALGLFRPHEIRLMLAGGLFVSGCVCFSANILIRAWLDIQTFKALIPWGGTSFILGWLALSLAFLRKVKPPQASESGDQTH